MSTARRGCCACRDAKTGPRMVPLTGPVLTVLDGIEREEGVPWVLRGRQVGVAAGLPLPPLAAHQDGDRAWRRADPRPAPLATPRERWRSARASSAIGRLLGHTRHRHHRQICPPRAATPRRAAATRTGDSITAHIMPGRAEAA